MGIRSIFVLCVFLILSLHGQVLDTLPDNFLLVTDYTYGAIYLMDISNYSYINISFQNLVSPRSITYDPIDKVIFWYDYSLRQIVSGSIYGNSQRTIHQLISDAPSAAISVDIVSRLLFYTDIGNRIIAALTLDGSAHKVVINTSLDQPFDIATDPITGERLSFDTFMSITVTNRQMLINTGNGHPIGLTVDFHADVLYWCDFTTYTIERANVDGSNRQIIYKEERVLFYRIALYKSYLYYTGHPKRSVMRIGTDGSNMTSVGPSSLGQFYAIHTHGSGPLDTNGCSNRSAGCSHFCFPRPGGYRVCACPEGLILLPDGQTCGKYTLPDNFLLVTDYTYGAIYLMDISNYSYINISFQNLVSPRSITYDPIDRVIFWFDYTLRQIVSGSIYGNSQRTIRHLNHDDAYASISVDIVSRLLFYADIGTRIIAALTLDGSVHKVVINTSLDQPLDIVTDPITGTIYWSASGSHGKIERSNYDGTNRQELINIGNGLPMGLTVDFHADVVYWCDPITHTIERANVDGSNRQIIYKEEGVLFYRIALYKSYLYYTGHPKRSVMRIGTDGSNMTSVGPSSLGQFYAIHTHGSGPLGTNGCSNRSAGCSHFCFPRPGGYRVCACPEGLILLPNGQTCGTWPTSKPPAMATEVTNMSTTQLSTTTNTTSATEGFPTTNSTPPAKIECYQNETKFCASRGAQCTRNIGTAVCHCSKGLEWDGDSEDCMNNYYLIIGISTGIPIAILVIFAIIIICIRRKRLRTRQGTEEDVGRMQMENNKELPHANPMRTEGGNIEYYEMSANVYNEIGNMPVAFSTISNRSAANEPRSDELEYMTLNISGRNAEHEYSYLNKA